MGLFSDFKIIGGELVKYKGKGGEVVIPDGVTAIKECAFEGCTSLTSVTIPESVTVIEGDAFYGCTSLTSVTIPDSVTRIDFCAFRRCSSLTSVTIPESVTAIKECAFEGCTSLTSVTIPESVTKISTGAFNGCTSLASVTIPARFKDSLTDIFGEELAKKEIFTFVDDATITSEFEIVDGVLVKYKGKGGDVVIPRGVTSIGRGAFLGCTSLTSVTIPESVTSIGPWAFANCISLASVTIPNGVTSIGSWAFIGCASLTSVTIPESVTRIGLEAFRGCTSLTSVSIPESATEIGEKAFEGCTSLVSVTIPPQFADRLGYIFDKELAKKDIFTFTGKAVAPVPPPSASVKSATDFQVENGVLIKYTGDSKGIKIPKGIQRIAADVFLGRLGLHSVAVTEGVESIGEDAFLACKTLSTVSIPKSVTHIGKRAFYCCDSLTSVTIPARFKDSLVDIFGEELAKKEIFTFVNDATLTSEFAIEDGELVRYIGKGGDVTIPDGVTSIGEKAFSGCTSLTSVTIPDSVTKIGTLAFSQCSSLAMVEMPESVTEIGVGAFSACAALTAVKIPDSMTSIGKFTFNGCSSLTEVTIPESVTAIGWGAFLNCTSLTSIVIPGSVMHMEKRAFSNCTSLTSVTIPPRFADKLTDIFGEDVAKKNIFTFTDEEGVTPAPMPVTFPPEFQVEDGVLLAYLGNEGEVHIPEGVTAIDGEAFTSEARVTAVYIPASVTEIEEATFADLPYLAAIHVDEESPAYRSVNGALYTKDMSVLLQYPVANRNTSYTAPETLRRVGKGSFYGCRELHYVNLGNVTEIGDYAFCGCLHLFSLSATAEEIEVGEDAFAECQKLERVDAPALLAKKDSIFPDSRV